MEKVSGDNYICRQEEDAGRFVMCLSDGMGSGVEACRESEDCGRTSGTVSGIRIFPGDGGEDGEFCSCSERDRKECFPQWISVQWISIRESVIPEAGAASTFIKRDHWVEAISSESLAAGLVAAGGF